MFMPPDARNGFPLLGARRYALALTEACPRVERHRATGSVARRVAGILTAEPLETAKLEAFAAALGVDVLELVAVDSVAAQS